MVLLLRTIWLWGALNTQQTTINYQADLFLPMDIPIILAGNFGELRPNHFHSGIDIKTNGKEGYKLYSIADGYVARIRTGTTGYGKVLYINHPELGITSVYAHCQNFLGKIGEYTTLAQNQAEFYENRHSNPCYCLACKKRRSHRIVW
jgi:murein DD-endopeptidase MepM/ murein hydrolase activator NlpD